MTEVKEKKPKKEAKALPDQTWVYYKLYLIFDREVLGAQATLSIYEGHMKEVIKKEMKMVNRLAEKTQKLDMRQEISPSKELDEFKGAVRKLQETLGKKEALPEEREELLAYAKELEDEYREAVGDAKITTFNIDPVTKKVRISSHVILGNMKENIKILKESNQQHFINSSKTGCDRMMALDIKVVEPWLYPDQDIVRKEDGTPFILERPISFPDGFGGTRTAIAQSEILPIGTKLDCTLRCRNGSSVAEEQNIVKLLEFGKNNGIGPWRGSGNKGAYRFKLEKLDDYVEVYADGYR
jgi:hypothetical protein